jgi:Superinfection immunity protein
MGDAAASSGGVILAVIWIVLAFAFYWTPTIVAWRRKVNNLMQIAILNLLTGWFLPTWVVALVWSLKPPPAVQLQIRADDPQAQATIAPKRPERA